MVIVSGGLLLHWVVFQSKSKRKHAPSATDATVTGPVIGIHIKHGLLAKEELLVFPSFRQETLSDLASKKMESPTTARRGCTF